jgi:hypothetical protein|tara:strand:+ start:1123 stop:1302 length:180 start_codon:yes stop_codon:yes gene_type:complete
MNHFANNGKEYLKRVEENNKYRQGRSKEQLRSSYICAAFSIGGILLIGLISLLHIVFFN